MKAGGKLMAKLGLTPCVAYTRQFTRPIFFGGGCVDAEIEAVHHLVNTILGLNSGLQQPPHSPNAAVAAEDAQIRVDLQADIALMLADINTALGAET
jgi:hypothetical protein